MEAREVVIPGELIEEKKGRKVGRGAYFEGEKIFAKVLGIVRADENEISIIPLSGVYMPRMGNRVIGVVSDFSIAGWMVDINCPYRAFLPLSEATSEFIDRQRTDISKFFGIGDILFCKVSKVTRDKNIQVSMRVIGSRKLYNGIIIKVTPSKIPRIIGKGGSMIKLLKNNTGCEILAGQNGVVWIRGLNKAKAIEAILTIEKESHIVGLTEKIEKMLGEKNG